MFHKPVLAALIFVLLFSQAAYSESPTLHSLGKYKLRLYSDGSGSFGLPKDLELFRNLWSVHITKDEMTDKIKITAYRMGRIDIGGRKVSAPLGLYIDLSKSSNEFACVFGHDFPGRTAMIRVGGNAPVKTNKGGCVALSKDLDKQLRSGQMVKVRGREWPNDWDRTFDVNLDGYTVLTDYLRSKR